MKPKQYQQGYTEFYKLKFKVTPDVLIPRPETELLVDQVLEFIKGKASTSSANNIVLDIGTGAGNIAISIAKNLASHIPSGNVKIIATDISEKALEVAKQNAKLHGVEDKIKFVHSDLLSVIASEAKQSSQEKKPIKIATSVVSLLPRNDNYSNLILVTNLPYIPTERIPYLDSSVKDYEPHVALDGGTDGFELYRKLFSQIKEKDWKPSLIIGEIDYTHGELAADEARKYFPKAIVEVKTDLAHKQRILTISLRG